METLAHYKPGPRVRGTPAIHTAYHDNSMGNTTGIYSAPIVNDPNGPSMIPFDPNAAYNAGYTAPTVAWPSGDPIPATP